MMEGSLSTLKRRDTQGYGTHGAEVYLPLANLQDLAGMLGEVSRRRAECPSDQLFERLEMALSFIVGDVKSPLDPNIWKGDVE